MPSKKTYWLFIAFAVIFLIAAPLIIFCASGWRYDFKRKKIVKTGSFSLNSYPSGGKVYLNGKLKKQSFFRKIFFYKTFFKSMQIDGSTPSLISNLLPDEYLLEIKKENYRSWQKKLTIEGEKTTFVKNADLFLEKPAIKLLKEWDAIEQKISPNQKKIAYLTKNKDNVNVEIFDFKTEKATIIYQSPFLKSLISWSPSSENILIKEIKGEEEHYLIVPLSASERLDLKKILPKNQSFKNPQWENNFALLGVLDDNLYRINLIQKTSQILFQAESGDYLVKNNTLYQLKNTKNDFTLVEINPFSKEKKIITPLPYSDDYKFLNLPLPFIALIDQKNNLLFLINPQIKSGDKKIILKAEAKSCQFIPPFNQLLYNDNFEISVFNLEEKKKKIITRAGQEIEKALFYHLGYTVIFSSKNYLYVIETDERDKKNFMELLKIDEINDFFIPETPKILYLIGQIENRKGLFKITVQ